MEFSKGKFRSLRLQKGWTLREVAERVGVSQQSVQLWESGKTSPGSKHYPVLANVFRCEIKDFCTYEQDEVQPVPQEEQRQWIKLPIVNMAQAASIGTENFPLANCLADEDAAVTGFSLSRKNDYIIRVSGTSALPWFPDGTLLLVRYTQDIRNGDLVTAVFADGTSVFKVFVSTGKRIALLAINREGKGKDYIFERDTFTDDIKLYRVVQSMRDERSLAHAMTQNNIRHFWEDILAKMRNEDGD